MSKPGYAWRRHGGPPKADLGRPPILQRPPNPCRAEGAFVAVVVTRNAYEAKAAAAVSTMARILAWANRSWAVFSSTVSSVPTT